MDNLHKSHEEINKVNDLGQDVCIGPVRKQM